MREDEIERVAKAIFEISRVNLPDETGVWENESDLHGLYFEYARAAIEAMGSHSQATGETASPIYPQQQDKAEQLAFAERPEVIEWLAECKEALRKARSEDEGNTPAKGEGNDSE